MKCILGKPSEFGRLDKRMDTWLQIKHRSMVRRILLHSAFYRDPTCLTSKVLPGFIPKLVIVADAKPAIVAFEKAIASIKQFGKAMAVPSSQLKKEIDGENQTNNKPE